MYNDLKRRLADGAVTSQRLLIPVTLPVTASEAASVEENSQLLARIGFDLAAFGPQTLAVQALPAILLERVDPVELVREILDQARAGLRAGRIAHGGPAPDHGVQGRGQGRRPAWAGGNPVAARWPPG